jgi:hypothetical protein
MSIPDRTAKSNGEGAVTAGLPRVDEADLSHDPLAEFYALAKAEIDVEVRLNMNVAAIHSSTNLRCTVET